MVSYGPGVPAFSVPTRFPVGQRGCGLRFQSSFTRFQDWDLPQEGSVKHELTLQLRASQEGFRAGLRVRL